MTTYNAILQLLKRNKASLLLGIIIMGIITVFYAGQLKAEPEDLGGAKIVIFDKDDSAISRSLVKQLSTQHERVTLEDDSQKGIDDALYFDKAGYVLTIPKNFGADLAAGNKATVDSQTKPGTFSKSLVNTTINHFLNTYQTFQKQMPSMSQKEILTMTQDTLSEEGTVHFDNTYHQKRRQTVKASIYNLLAYGLFMTIFSGYSVINLAFNRKEIKDRNSCSPVSRRKLSRRISIGSLVYSFVCFVIFMAFVFFATDSGFNLLTGYFLLNTLVFSSVMVAFSILVTSVIKSSEAIAGINNVFIMGSCFISGVFVPTDMLPDVVMKIGSFTPTYWFVQNNELLGKTIEFNQAFKDKFLQQCLILLAFTAVFLVIHLITMKEKGGLSLFSKKENAVLEQ
ncbi:ABC transporter permease [Candidatus Enterococcus ferrettii]|uniref:ABC-2 type transport system permease n=1 Tax=Candidatus Enterococcus ferrettii TaxID=2815324 RepID=A0ABV0ESB2_9ENTE|nr:ABC transporter permease [Enterococcus sp. 665A]MBO1343079.1 ABC transporter permease [Enterococcus sp. 665A]